MVLKIFLTGHFFVRVVKLIYNYLRNQVVLDVAPSICHWRFYTTTFLVDSEEKGTVE